MALQGPIPVEFGTVFPSGAYAAGAFEPVRNFDASTGEKFVQSHDKATGMPLWSIEVIDPDPQADQGQQAPEHQGCPQADHVRDQTAGEGPGRQCRHPANVDHRGYAAEQLVRGYKLADGTDARAGDGIDSANRAQQERGEGGRKR